MSKARTELKVQKKGAITGERLKLSEQQQTGTQYRTECGIKQGVPEGEHMN